MTGKFMLSAEVFGRTAANSQANFWSREETAVEVLGTGDAQAGGVFSDASGNFSLTVNAGTYSVLVSLLVTSRRWWAL